MAKDKTTFHGAAAELLHNQPPQTEVKASTAETWRQAEGTARPMDPEKALLLETLQAMQARLALLEHREQARADAALNPTLLLDAAHEAWKIEASRPASERTQDIADRRYGTEAPRFTVRLDPTDDQGKTVNIAEHFPLTLSAHSDLEAGARYLDAMHITKHDYRLVIEAAA